MDRVIMSSTARGGADVVDTAVLTAASAVFGHAVTEVDPVSQQTEPGWDSLRHIELLLAVEDALSIRFDDQELSSLISLRLVADAARKHCAA
jgi:acyl carrier protein